ncbi:prephenate dehydrogenase [Candidatus Marithrix sp. Canyon 246]|uniref:prephenate dehydrogenase n=1 Tax=Candidatus Marithrix sp. Canyon 246 TaxID=1827136 RepID=UPI00084A0F67|nr:prephenate dehydrogenase/arogenate dehydrogenase family protein [Candidatus Marithrix sp. Canyon 246]
MLVKRLTIIGVGLIGGSIARALKRINACDEIIGCGRNVANLETAIELGVIDKYETQIDRAVANSDLIIVAVPLRSIAGIFKTISKEISPDTIITDVGSAKASVIADAKQYLGQHFPQFVPGHPIAGTEKSGVAASFAELFEDHKVILTPVAETNPAAVETVTLMWQKIGATVVKMSVAQHDEILAATSHLPHLLAYSLVNTLNQMNPEIFEFAAGGFRDFTRIASSDPTMWHDISLSNRDAILKMLGLFRNQLDDLTKAIQQGDSSEIKDIFSRAKIARDQSLC